MSLFWKGLVVLLLALPVGAYVTGSLAGSGAKLPDRQAPVVVEDPEPAPTQDVAADDDRGAEPERERQHEADGRDDRVQVVRPEPSDVGDDVDDDDDGHDDFDDGADTDDGDDD